MGLFRGMGATLLREPVQFAIYYPSVSSIGLVKAADKLMAPTSFNPQKNNFAVNMLEFKPRSVPSSL